MRKVVLYIAASLDGKIARPDGDTSWLEALPNPSGTDHRYGALLERIDTTLMGYQTYAQILGFGIPFPYADKTNFVFTRQARPEAEFVQFISGDVVEFVRDLRASAGKDIWLIGGGQINTLLLNAGLVDEIQLAIAPLILGAGIPLLAEQPLEQHFQLAHAETFDTGIVLCTYLRKALL